MAVAVYTSLLTLDEAPGGTVTVQDAGTATPRAIFTDAALTIAATNPIPLDTAGRATQGQIYTAATAYKVIVKDEDGITLYTRDYIDPGIPLGSGILPIASGGTGGDTPAEALTNLGGATSTEVADALAQVAALAGTLASVEKTHIATGTTGQRPVSPIEGDIRRNTTTAKFEGYNGTAFANFATFPGAAATPTVQVLTSGTTYTTPVGVKWIKVRAVGAGGGGAGTGGNGGAGGNTTFNSIAANGGAGGTAHSTHAGGAGGVGGTSGAGSATFRVPGGAGGGGGSDVTDSVAGGRGGHGGLGGSSAFGGNGRGGVAAAAGTAGATNSGGGGGGSGGLTGTPCTGGDGGGGAGEYLELIIGTPSASYTYALGAAGAAGASTGGTAGGAGAAGQIIVEEYYVG